MIDKFLALFGVHRVGMIVTVASQVIRTFEQEFAQDGNAKNAAIDSIIEILNQHKTAAPPLASKAPVAPAVPPVAQ